MDNDFLLVVLFAVRLKKENNLIEQNELKRPLKRVRTLMTKLYHGGIKFLKTPESPNVLLGLTDADIEQFQISVNMFTYNEHLQQPTHSLQDLCLLMISVLMNVQ